MPTIIRKPVFRIWVEGHPQSVQGDSKHLAQYRKRISQSALKIVPYPTKSNNIDIEIFFVYKRALRPDVDNIIKPILDALKGIAYMDDSQVRSIHVTALPAEEAYGISGWTNREAFIRLTATTQREFLIEIFEGFSTYLGPS